MDYSQNRPYPAKSDPKSIPFQGSARLTLSPIITGERHGGDEIRKRAHLQAGLEQRGVGQGAPKGRNTITHTKDPSWICSVLQTECPGTHPSIRATPSLPSNKSGWTRLASLAIIPGASEKIRPQIRRPSFSDSLLTPDSKTLLSGAEKRVSAAECAFSTPRKRVDTKMLPKSGQDSFRWSNNVHSAWEQREGAGAQYTLCRGRSVPRLSPGPSLYFFVSASLPLSAVWGKTAALDPKRSAGRPWGWETVSFPQPSTISTFVQYVLGVIFPIPMR